MPAAAAARSTMRRIRPRRRAGSPGRRSSLLERAPANRSCPIVRRRSPRIDAARDRPADRRRFHAERDGRALRRDKPGERRPLRRGRPLRLARRRCRAGRGVEVARSGTRDVDAAAAAARRAFDHGYWPKLAPFERGRVLRAIADAIRGDLQTLAEVETRSGGKTLANSNNEVEAAARVFEYYAGAGDKFFGETIPMGEGVLDFTLREPVGVAAQITPWNFPFLAAA